MRKIWLIVKREYITRVRSKGFVLATVAFPLLFIGVFVFSAALATRQRVQASKVAILDEVGGLGASIKSNLKEKLPGGIPAIEVVRIYDRSGQEHALRQDLLEQVRAGQLDGFLVVPGDALGVKGSAAELHTKNAGDIRLKSSIAQAINQAVIARRLAARGISISDPGDFLRQVDLTLVKVTKEGESEDKGQTVAIAMVVTMALYMTLLIYGVATMRSVLEEKTTRMVEILVSSVRPFQLMMGKIIGIAAVALTQYLIWTASGSLLAGFGAGMAAALQPGTQLPKVHLPFALLAYVLFFLLGGYLLYASLFSAVGAMVSNEQDMQQAQAPVTLLIIVPVLLFGLVMRSPNSTLAVILSSIPFFSPILMPLRIALQTPPLWQIALSVVLLALTTLGVVHISGKIYRVGILMSGKRPSLVELSRWLKYS
jgi:ABC-2 type transport system permease protein